MIPKNNFIGWYNPLVRTIEQLEKGTPEFRTLTQEQQDSRRTWLIFSLKTVLGHYQQMGIPEAQVRFIVSDILELHLTGKINKLALPAKKTNI